MNFLVIGANSFVGKRIYSEIISQGHTCIGTYNSSPPTGNHDLVKFNILEDKIESVLSKEFLKENSVNYAVICSALPQIDLCKREPEKTRKVNIIATERIIIEMKQLNIIPIFLSTSYVFEGNRGNYKEFEKPIPSCEYARQKLEVEEFLKNTCEQFLVLRCDKILSYSAGGKHLFSEWQTLIEEKKPIVCIKDQIMSPCFAEDIAKIIIIGCKNKLSGIFHMSSGEQISRFDLAKRFVSSHGIDWQIIERDIDEFNFDETRPLRTSIDNSLLASKTKFKFTTLNEGIIKFLKNLK